MNRIRLAIYILGGAVVIGTLLAACYPIGAAFAQPDQTPATTTPEWHLPVEAWIALGLAALGSVRQIVRGATELVGLISRRTVTTRDDDLYRKMDKVADTLDDIAARLPGGGTGTSALFRQKPPQAGKTTWGAIAVMSMFPILIAIAGQLAGAGCAGTRDRIANGVGAFIDCEADNLRAAAADSIPLAKRALLYAISPDGLSIDTAALRADASSIKSTAVRCALASAFAALLNPPKPVAGAPASSALEVDPAVVRAAFEELRPALGGAAFKTSAGVL